MTELLCLPPRTENTKKAAKNRQKENADQKQIEEKHREWSQSKLENHHEGQISRSRKTKAKAKHNKQSRTETEFSSHPQGRKMTEAKAHTGSPRESRAERKP